MRKLFLIIIFYSFLSNSFSQENMKPYMLDSIVGEKIERIEIEKYYLFDFIKSEEIEYCVIFQTSDTLFQLHVVLSDSTEQDHVLSRKNIEYYRDNIKRLYVYHKTIEEKATRIKTTDSTSLFKEELLTKNIKKEYFYFRIYYLAPSVSIELAAGATTSLLIDLGSGFEVNTSNMSLSALYDNQSNLGNYYSGNSKKGFILHPYIKADYRNYYNYKKRKKKGCVVERRSANFFSFYALAFVNQLHFGPTWGLQRNANKFAFSFNIGFGGLVGGSSNHTVISDIRLGMNI